MGDALFRYPLPYPTLFHRLLSFHQRHMPYGLLERACVCACVKDRFSGEPFSIRLCTTKLPNNCSSTGVGHCPPLLLVSPSSACIPVLGLSLHQAPKNYFPGSIMSLSNTGGGGRGSDQGSIVGDVILHGKKEFWRRGGMRAHMWTFHRHLGELNCCLCVSVCALVSL